MPDILAIVSKAVFEKDSPKAKLGSVLPMKVYRSANKQLEKLDKKSRLFLVTVRPPDEALWLVAVLESPQFDDEMWSAEKNQVPVADISALIPQLKFESGKGLQAKKGALGMSLQTPRVLSPSDAELLLKAAGAAKAAKVRPPRPPGPVNLVKHEDKSPLPCLCAKCYGGAPESIEVDGATYIRGKVEVCERILWFWVPAELNDELPAITDSVRSRLLPRLKPYKSKDGAAPIPQKPAAQNDDDDEDDDDE